MSPPTRYYLFWTYEADLAPKRFRQLHGIEPAEVIPTGGGVLVGPIPQDQRPAPAEAQVQQGEPLVQERLL